MIYFRHVNKKNLLAVSLLSVIAISGCDKLEDSPEEHLKKGIEYLNKGDVDKAKLELKASSEGNKNSAETYYYLALVDEKAKNFKGMKENLLKTIELSPNYSDARLKLGRILLLFGEVDASQQQADFILKSDSKNLDAMTLKASGFVRNKQVNEAMPLLNHILTEKPDHAEALGLKALIYMDKNDFNTAFDLLGKAKAADSHNIALDVFKIHMDTKTKNIDAIVTDYEKLVENYPDNIEFKATLAKIYTQTGKLNEAEKLLLGLMSAEPNKVNRKIYYLDFLAATEPSRIIPEFDKFVNQHSKQSRILFELAGWMINNQKNFEKGKEVLKRVLEIEENSVMGLSAKTVIAKIEFERKNYEQTEKIVNEILEINPNYDDAKIIRAKLLINDRKQDEAIDLLSKILWSNPNSQETLILLANASLQKGDVKQADKYYKDILAINPVNLQAANYTYDKAIQNKDLKYAQELLEKALSVMPDSIIYLEKYANLNLIKQDFNKVKAVSEQIAVNKNPLAIHLASYFNARVFEAQDNCLKAVEIYRELLEKFPDHEGALTGFSNCYEKMNKRSEMIVFLNNLLTKKPNNIPATILQSHYLVVDKQFEKAANLLSDALKNNAGEPKLYDMLASTKLKQNDISGAITIYKKGVQENPDNAKLALTLAALYEKQANYDAAISVYEELLVKNPSFDIVRNNLALVLSEHVATPDKLKRAEQLTELFKDSADVNFRDTYAWVLVKKGDFNKAISILTTITSTVSDVPTFRYHLAVAQAKSGNRILAISELKQALELNKKLKAGEFLEQKEAEALLADLMTNK